MENKTKKYLVITIDSFLFLEYIKNVNPIMKWKIYINI